MAETLELSVQTVSRAYEELIRRGLISGETGRGTFIRPPQREPVPPYIPERLSEVIDLSILKPVVCETRHIDAMKAALHALADDLPHSAVLSFRPNTLFARHRRVAQGWLREHCGVEATPGTIHLTNGATSGMTIALMAAAPPGSTVVTEAVGHHTLVPLAAYLGLRLRGVAIDAEGVIPEALDEACSEGDVRAPVRHAEPDQRHRQPDGRGAAGRDRRGGAPPRPADHRERRAGAAAERAAAAAGRPGAGAHAVRHHLHQMRDAGAARRLSGGAGPAGPGASPTAAW